MRASSATAGTNTDGGTLVASGGANLTGGSLLGTGTMTGALRNAAVMQPGSLKVTGTLTDTGAHTQAAGGALDIALAGGTKFDVLKSTTAVLGGTLNLSELGTYVPKVGSSFKILDFNF